MMSFVNEPEIAQLADQLSDCYRIEDMNRINMIIDNVELEGAPMIMSRRFVHFKTLLENDIIEWTSTGLQLCLTPFEGFKPLLKWIYTGHIEFGAVEDALEILNLCHMYDITELKNHTIEHLKSICDVDTVCLILNDAVFLSLTGLSFYLRTFIVRKIGDVLAHETFTKLTKNALDLVLTDAVNHVPNVDILNAFVHWMMANGRYSEYFSDTLRKIPLNSINFVEVVSIVPSELISVGVLVEIVREQMRKKDLML